MKYLEFFGITLEPQMLEIKSRALKTRNIAYNKIQIWATLSVYSIGWWRHQNNRKT